MLARQDREFGGRAGGLPIPCRSRRSKASRLTAGLASDRSPDERVQPRFRPGTSLLADPAPAGCPRPGSPRPGVDDWQGHHRRGGRRRAHTRCVRVRGRTGEDAWAGDRARGLGGAGLSRRRTHPDADRRRSGARHAGRRSLASLARSPLSRSSCAARGEHHA